jgi:hypothetical protein
MTDLFGVTLPEMIRELERDLDARAAVISMLNEHASFNAAGAQARETAIRRFQIVAAIIARLKRGAAEAA